MNLPKKGIYRHFKGKRYELLDFARHSETDEIMVVYRGLYGEHELWVRPLSMWNEEIERDGKRYIRFVPDEDEQKATSVKLDRVNHTSDTNSAEDKYALLKRIYGYDSFREGQEEVIDSILNGRDTLAILPTGAGKSLCYQLPALMLKGITLVVSPLISLMKDQVNALTQAGIPAAYLNSSLSERQFDMALKRMQQGNYCIIYVAPERLLTQRFLHAVESLQITMVAVDEAHCISQWGQEFRPSYLEIPEFISKLTQRPRLCAFTATATERVKDDVIRLLEMRAPFVRITGFNRANLYFSVSYTHEKEKRLMELMQMYHGFSGIIYCATRKGVESICEKLLKNGYIATRYHAGLSEEERHHNQEEFIYDRIPIMVATNAFGMGIDKSNVRFVIHFNMPKDIESYYQEAGRAGRDGERADCHLLFEPKDAVLQNFFIDRMGEESELDAESLKIVQANARSRLRAMTDYCWTNQCLRKKLLRYFGEEITENCQYCANCLEPRGMSDVTGAARLLVNLVVEQRGRFGTQLMIDVIRGVESERIRSLRLNRSDYHGALKGLSHSNLQYIIDALIESDILSIENGDYPLLIPGKYANELLDGMREVYAYQIENKSKSSKRPEEHAFPENIDETLFEALYAERMKLSRSRSIPPYSVCDDSVLIDMCRKIPKNKEEMRFVKGMGESKIQAFGSTFLRVIQNHQKEKQ